MTDTAIIYLFLKYLELASFFYFGYRLSKTKDNSSYWRYAIFPIILYALIEGLRWGRMTDYNYYYHQYHYLKNWISYEDNANPLFTIICYAFKLVGISYPVFLMFQCGLLMCSCIYFLKPYKRYALFCLPLVLVVTAMNENFIRWWFALSFIYIGLHLYLSKKYILALAVSLCGYFIHWGVIAIIPMVFLFPVLNNIKISPHIITCAFLFSLFALSANNMNFIVWISDKFIDEVPFDNEVMLNYMNASNNIISGEFGDMGTNQRNLTNQLKLLITYIPIFYIAPMYMKKIRYGMSLYNWVAIGSILHPPFSQVELLGRYSEALIFFDFIVSGCTLYFVVFRDKKCEDMIKAIVTLSYIVNFYAIINGPFVRPDDLMLFLWDSGGRGALN